MFGNARVDQLDPQYPKRRERAFLIRTHQPRVARDIGRQYRRRPPLDPLSLTGVYCSNPEGCRVGASFDGLMQTPTTRSQHSRTQLCYGSDLADIRAGFNPFAGLQSS
jgi:hypothetical protein